MEKIIRYYVDINGNYYIDTNDNYYIGREILQEAPTKLHYEQYKPYFYNNGSFKKYTAYIRQADGSYIRTIPYICTNINIAIAGIAIPGVSYVSSPTTLKSLDNAVLKSLDGFYLTTL